MPLYNVETPEGKTFEIECSYEDLKEREKKGHFVVLPSSLNIVSGQGTLQSKSSDGFNDLLTNIKGKHRGSTIKTK